MPLRRIDMDAWNRRDIYEYFSGTVMYTTVHMDITDFLAGTKERGIRFYPAMIHCIATVANGCEEFRYGRDEQGHVGVWDRVDPLYTVPREKPPELFSMVSTGYSADFSDFSARFSQDYVRARQCGQLICGALEQSNFLGVTAMPGLHFSSFSFGDTQTRPDLTPFVVLGRYEKRDGRVILPVFGEFVHSVNDGYHISLFFESLKQVCGGFCRALEE